MNTFNSFHWHVQNAVIPCRSQELLPFFLIIHFFLPLFSANYASILPHFVLPSISWSTSRSCCSQIHKQYTILFWEFCFLPFSVRFQTNVIYVTLLTLTIQNYQRDALNIIYSSNIITLLYMFRVSSTHLQEDIVEHKQHMVRHSL